MSLPTSRLDIDFLNLPATPKIQSARYMHEKEERRVNGVNRVKRERGLGALGVGVSESV